MPYADTDFFIAIANPDDRLNSWAIKVLEDYEGHSFDVIYSFNGALNTEPRIREAADGIYDTLKDNGILTFIKLDNIFLS